LLSSRLGLIGSALGLSLLVGSPLNAQAADPSPKPTPKKLTQEEEFARCVAMRKQWIAKLPEGSTTVLDLPYVPGGETPGSRPASLRTLDLYIPKGTGPFPLIVWIHGGAWKGGNKEQDGAMLAAHWLPEGFAVASLNYRFVFDAPFPGMFQDCLDALAFLRGHAAQYHLNPGKVGIVGASAGGHIAGVVAMAAGTPAYRNTGGPVQGAVLMCGFYDLTMETGTWKQGAFVSNPRDDFSNLYPGRTYDPAIAKKMSPVYLIQPNSPPVLIVHGDKDITTAPRVQSELMLAALQKNHVPSKLTDYPNYGHGLLQPDVLAEASDFFKRTLQGK